MKVLLATGLYPPEVGGPATYTKQLEDELPTHGIEVIVLPFSSVRALPLGIRHVAYFWKCLRLASRVDVVYAQDVVSVGLPASIAARLAHKKLVVRVPGDYAWEQGRQRWGVEDELDQFQTKTYGWRVEVLRAIERRVVHQASSVVVPSEYMARIVRNWLSVQQEKVVTIYSSVTLPEQVIPHKRSAPFLVVSSGRRVPWKHFDVIEQVVTQVPGWQFFLASGLPRAEALSWVKAADVYVLNSTYEGLSHALVEAMLLGTPVIATSVGGNPELIRDSIDGLLIPAGDKEALTRAVHAVQENPQEAAKRAQSARERAQAFTVEATIQKIVTLLQTL
jgi:glycosyltransferase involved in cell wall biosynthesis